MPPRPVFGADVRSSLVGRYADLLRLPEDVRAEIVAGTVAGASSRLANITQFC
jgi:hypothetical protein